MAQPFFSIIIPAYNEAERLPLTLVDLDKHFGERSYAYEILVVNDGSTDKTREVAASFSRMMKNLKFIHNEENKGKGAAVRQGMLLARGKYRATLDADNAVHPSHIEDAVPYLKGGAHIVLGVRTRESKIWPPLPPFRQLTERLNNVFISPILFGSIRSGFEDLQSGFKVFTDEAAERIFSQAKVQGWGFDLETLALARAMEYPVKEIAVLWRHNSEKSMPLFAYLRNLVDAARIRWWLSRGKYNI
ncbi:MAG: glycosyltransferase [Patescibacteria group bacterium]